MKRKMSLLKSLKTTLIIAFKTRELLEKCKANYNEYWDDEEIYFVFEELKESLYNKNISFTEISHCSGVIQISK